MPAASPPPETFDDGSPPAAWRAYLLYAVAGLAVLGIAWFIYTQMTAVRGVKVEAPPPQAVTMLPPPPPPPPPPPEPQEKPPEPVEQPAPTPDQPSTPKPAEPQAAAPVTVAGAAQAGTDAFGLAAGGGGGIGSPGGGGTCLGTKCGTGGGGGGGMSEGVYRRYLSSALQERVQGDDAIARLIFSADYTLTVTPDGRVQGVRFVGQRGGAEGKVAERLTALLERVSGLTPPPATMQFPQRITVRGRRMS
jgi:protein TonB